MSRLDKVKELGRQWRRHDHSDCKPVNAKLSEFLKPCLDLEAASAKDDVAKYLTGLILLVDVGEGDYCPYAHDLLGSPGDVILLVTRLIRSASAGVLADHRPAVLKGLGAVATFTVRYMPDVHDALLGDLLQLLVALQDAAAGLLPVEGKASTINIMCMEESLALARALHTPNAGATTSGAGAGAGAASGASASVRPAPLPPKQITLRFTGQEEAMHARDAVLHVLLHCAQGYMCHDGGNPSSTASPPPQLGLVVRANSVLRDAWLAVVQAAVDEVHDAIDDAEGTVAATVSADVVSPLAQEAAALEGSMTPALHRTLHCARELLAITALLATANAFQRHEIVRLVDILVELLLITHKLPHAPRASWGALQRDDRLHLLQDTAAGTLAALLPSCAVGPDTDSTEDLVEPGTIADDQLQVFHCLLPQLLQVASSLRPCTCSRALRTFLDSVITNGVFVQAPAAASSCWLLLESLAHPTDVNRAMHQLEALAARYPRALLAALLAGDEQLRLTPADRHGAAVGPMLALSADQAGVFFALHRLLSHSVASFGLDSGQPPWRPAAEHVRAVRAAREVDALQLQVPLGHHGAGTLTIILAKPRELWLEPICSNAGDGSHGVYAAAVSRLLTQLVAHPDKAAALHAASSAAIIGTAKAGVIRAAIDSRVNMLLVRAMADVEAVLSVGGAVDAGPAADTRMSLAVETACTLLRDLPSTHLSKIHMVSPVASVQPRGIASMFARLLPYALRFARQGGTPALPSIASAPLPAALPVSDAKTALLRYAAQGNYVPALSASPSPSAPTLSFARVDALLEGVLRSAVADATVPGADGSSIAAVAASLVDAIMACIEAAVDITFRSAASALDVAAMQPMSVSGWKPQLLQLLLAMRRLFTASTHAAICLLESMPAAVKCAALGKLVCSLDGLADATGTGLLLLWLHERTAAAPRFAPVTGGNAAASAAKGPLDRHIQAKPLLEMPSASGDAGGLAGRKRGREGESAAPGNAPILTTAQLNAVLHDPSAGLQMSAAMISAATNALQELEAGGRDERDTELLRRLHRLVSKAGAPASVDAIQCSARYLCARCVNMAAASRSLAGGPGTNDTTPSRALDPTAVLQKPQEHGSGAAAQSRAASTRTGASKVLAFMLPVQVPAVLKLAAAALTAAQTAGGAAPALLSLSTILRHAAAGCYKLQQAQQSSSASSAMAHAGDFDVQIALNIVTALQSADAAVRGAAVEAAAAAAAYFHRTSKGAPNTAVSDVSLLKEVLLHGAVVEAAPASRKVRLHLAVGQWHGSSGHSSSSMSPLFLSPKSTAEVFIELLDRVAQVSAFSVSERSATVLASVLEAHAAACVATGAADAPAWEPLPWMTWSPQPVDPSLAAFIGTTQQLKQQELAVSSALRASGRVYTVERSSSALQPSYKVAESLRHSGAQYACTSLLALIDLWLHLAVSGAAVAHRQVVVDKLRRLAAASGATVYGLLCCYRDELLPRLAMPFMDPQLVLPAASRGTQPLHVFPAFIDEVCSGEVSPQAFAGEAAAWWVPTLAVVDGGCKQQLTLLAWYLRWHPDYSAVDAPTFPGESALNVSITQADVPSSASAPAPPSAGAKRKQPDVTSPQASKPKRQRSIAEYADQSADSSRSAKLDDRMSWLIPADTSASDDSLPAFRALSATAKRRLVARILLIHASQVLARILLTPAPVQYAMSISALMLDHVHADGVMFFATHVFEATLTQLCWHLTEVTDDWPHNRAALALRSFAVLVLDGDRMELSRVVRPANVRKAVITLAEAQLACSGLTTLPGAGGASGAMSGTAAFMAVLSHGSADPSAPSSASRMMKTQSGMKGGVAIATAATPAALPAGHTLAPGTASPKTLEAVAGWRSVDVISHVPDLLMLIPLSLANWHVLELPAKVASGEVQAAVVAAARDASGHLRLPLEMLLQRYLLLVMSKVSQVLSKPQEPAATKVRALVVLQRVCLRLAGETRLDKHVPSITALLKLALAQTGTRVAASAVWYVFVRMLSDAALQQYLSVLVVGLLPYVEKQTAAGANSPASLLAFTNVRRDDGSAVGDRTFDASKVLVERYDSLFRAELAAALPDSANAATLVYADAPPAMPPVDGLGIPILPGAATGADGKRKSGGGTVIAAMQAAANASAEASAGNFAGAHSVRDFAARTLRYLMIQKASVLQQHFVEIPSLASVEGFNEFQNIWTAAVAEPSRHSGGGAGAAAVADASSPLETRLPKLIGLLRTDSDAVQEMALRELEALLTNNVSVVHKLIRNTSPDGVASVIADLMAALLDLCRTSAAPTVKQLCGACLGQLGAVDPSRLTVEVRHQTGPQLADRRLMVQLIRGYLVKALRAAPDIRVQSKFTYALQQLLRVYADLCEVGKVEKGASGGAGAADASRPSAASDASKRKVATAVTKPGANASTTVTVLDDDADGVAYVAGNDSTGAVPLPSELRAAFGQDMKALLLDASAGIDIDVHTDVVERETVQLLEVIAPFYSSKLRLVQQPTSQQQDSASYQPFYRQMLENPASGGKSRSGSSSTASRSASSPQFEDWLAVWTRWLIEHLVPSGAGTTVPPTTLQRVWDAVSAVVQFDVPTVLFVLPYLVRDALAAGPTAGDGGGAAASSGSRQHLREAVLAEITAVLEGYRGLRGRDGDRDGPASSPDGSSSRGGAAWSGVGDGMRVQQTSASGLQYRAVQAMFSVIDTLKTWKAAHEEERASVTQAMAAAAKAGTASASTTAHQQAQLASHGTAIASISWLLDNIPNRLLADAAFRIHAYARAMLYLETELRASNRAQYGSARVPVDAATGELADAPVGGVINGSIPYSRADLAHLQLIYSNIDEPDGMTGIAALRSQLLLSAPLSGGLTPDADAAAVLQGGAGAGAGGTGGGNASLISLRERMIEYEHEARWSDALMCYEQALEDLRNRDGGAAASAGLLLRQSSSGGGSSGGAGSSGRGSPPVSSDDQMSVALLGMPEATLHAGLLRCLKNVGHLETALYHAIGVLAKRPALAPAVTAHAVEAAWRLAHWEPLEQLLAFNNPGNGSGAEVSAAVPSTDKEPSGTSSASTAAAATVPVATATSVVDIVADTDTSIGSAMLYLFKASKAAAVPMADRVREQAAAADEASAADVATGTAVPISVMGMHSRTQELLSGICRGHAVAAALHALGAKDAQSLKRKRVDGDPAAVMSEADISMVTDTSTMAMLLSIVPQYVRSAGGEAVLHRLSRGGGSGPAAASRGLSSAALSAARRGAPDSVSANLQRFNDALAAARRDVMSGLAAASTESYTRAYPFLLKLHAIREVERAAELVRLSDASARPDVLKAMEWDVRLQIITPSLGTQEPLLALRRALYRLFNLRDREASAWLDLAKAARAAGHTATATSALLHAAALGSDVAPLQNAKLLHSVGQTHRALLELEPVERDLDKVVAELRSKAGRTQNSQQDRTVANPAADRQRILEAKKLLHATNWMAEARLASEQVISSRYDKVIALYGSWEKGHFFCARFYDGQFRAMLKDSPAPHPAGTPLGNNRVTSAQPVVAWIERRDSYLRRAIEHYQRSLRHHHKYIFQSMPRMLTLYFDYGAAAHAVSQLVRTARVPGSAAGPSAAAIRPEMPPEEAAMYVTQPVLAVRTGMQFASDTQLAKFNAVLEVCREKAACYRWMTALPQLCSRICHRHDTVYHFVSQTLLGIMLTYQPEASWHVIGLTLSRVQLRRGRAERIVTDCLRVMEVTKEKESLKVMQSLFNTLVKLAEQTPAKGVRSQPVSILSPELFAQGPVVVPLQHSLTVTLPTKDAQAWLTAKGFPNDSPTIARFDKTAEVMGSKEAPRKLTLHGSDGRRYAFLCKRESRGDLRKDMRMMDFATLLKRLMNKDAEGRRRKLSMRTYAVVCLNEDTGLLQWVQNTSGLRHEVQRCLTAVGLPPLSSTVKSIQDEFVTLQAKQLADEKERVHQYRQRILPQFTPVFHKWFLLTFSDPTAWFEARCCFARSAAVWSMVGHIIGLGDRHGENLLLDRTTGEVVHVDYDCIFDKGLRLGIPEIVPFRLTPCLLDGMGLSGYEGVFRRVCEVSMAVLRSNRDVLMSVLEPFIHDPLVEWTRSKDSQKAAAPAAPPSRGGAGGEAAATAQGGESENTDGVLIIQQISERLDGQYNAGVEALNRQRGRSVVKSAGLEVRGQVHRLLKEATSDDNLVRMYVGWMPFM